MTCRALRDFTSEILDATGPKRRRRPPTLTFGSSFFLHNLNSVRLKQLRISGFKSFADTTVIEFPGSVMGIVGPNGCGKSNVADSIRWVLGETSSKQLRGTGKMEDVIFGGTRRRGAMGFAQVRLTLDNSSHALDVEADEVTIGRKYYRSGDSEYTINGQVCRLRDVYELLLDTGIGRDGYSVIGQGRIAEIVAAKSSERREIFEEACGIAKYRYRKTEAERRLAAAGENLERLRDILGELESRVGPLEKESAKAQKFLELSAQRKTLEVTLWTDGVHRAREAVRQQVRDYETAQTDYERFDRETKAAEQEAEEIRMQAQQLTVAVERLNGDIRSITQQISGSESRIAVLENDILRNDESAASLQQEIAAGQQDALAQLYHLTRTAVYGLSLSYLKNTHDAQDITQDVFVHVWDHAPQYRPTGSPMGWLLTVCRNLCLMRLRHTERHAVLSEAEWDAIPQQETGLTTEERTLLQHVLSRLGEEERRIVLLHAVTGLKHREIAALLELPLPTVLSKYHRAIRKMRADLEGDNAHDK